MRSKLPVKCLDKKGSFLLKFQMTIKQEETGDGIQRMSGLNIGPFSTVQVT